MWTDPVIVSGGLWLVVAGCTMAVLSTTLLTATIPRHSPARARHLIHRTHNSLRVNRQTICRKWAPASTPLHRCPRGGGRKRWVSQRADDKCEGGGAGGEEQPLPRLGFSFTPAGLAFPYQLGVAKHLCDEGIITPEVPIAGASGGGLAALVVATDGLVSFDQAMQAALDCNERCRQVGTRGNLRDALKEQLDLLVTDDRLVDTLNQRPGGMGIATLQFRPFPRPLLVSRVNDLDDIKQLMLATSCIPFYFAKLPAVRFRGWPCIDGYFCYPKKQFGAPDTPSQNTVRSCPFPEAFRDEPKHLVIGPDPNKPAMPRRELFETAVGAPCASDETLWKLYEQGQEDAKRWVQQHRVTAEQV